jgi:pimeloyl-ACP methyl ester carboxylesterase
MERAILGNLTFAYEVVGTGEPVIGIHGAFVADTFRPLVEEPRLTARYQIIRYHRRGYGQSRPPPGPVSVAQQARDCRDLLTQLGIARAHVVGHSLGGVIALQLALDAPSVVHSLVLLEPALAVGASGPSYRAALAQGMQRYQELGAETAVDEALQARWPGYREPLERALPGAFGQAVADARTPFEYELAALLDWQFREVEARRIGQPVLSVLGGRSEELWPRFGETHRWLLAALPRAEGVVLPGVTHFLHVENPRGAAELLGSFFARHPLLE